MKKISFLTTCFIVLLGLVSCQEINEVPEVVISKTPVLSNELAKTVHLIDEFRTTVNQNSTQTKSSLSSQIIVKSVEKQSLTFNLSKEVTLTKNSNSNSPVIEGTTSVDLETVAFEMDGREGFAIATTDSRINRVYAYTENGVLSDTVFNKGLAATLYNIQFIIKQDVENFYTGSDKVTTKADQSKNVVIGPLLNTAWDQSAPYNNSLPTCTNGGRVPAGCTNVAVAQVIAYYNFPATYSNWYNLSTLRTKKKISSSAAEAATAAEFMRIVGLGCQTKYACDGSGASIASAHSYLSDLEFYNMQRVDDANVNEGSLYRNILHGNPHITSGFTKKPRVGHAWVWDGISARVTGSELNTLYAVHCNWGWGGYCDGWYASYETPNDGSGRTYLDDNVQLYIWMYWS